ncbi:sodium/glucose cotransporter 4-like [Paramacrobiotus metropolitanus]|uniref:sodium/glucose cotransporter 4-like n=1 Tax=Paramacrobiotus metropolitanus TaxID=2943436 RepID=UPI00244656A0|nr:sodium/glucose cotransporter 4-like [Paramacrobiotus metropolitanus]
MTSMHQHIRGSLLHWTDVVVITGYFVLVLAVGIWSSRQTVRSGSISNYFLAGRSMNFVLVGTSLFASNIGSGHFIGLAGSGAATGIGIAAFELNAVFITLLLGWIFVPVYIAAGIYTMPEYLQKRYGGQRIRIYLSLLTLFLYVFTKISADLFAGAIFIEQSLQWDLYLSAAVLLFIAAFFTITGGLSAVIWTDFVQCVIMLAGAMSLLVVVMVKVGGYQSLISQFPLVKPTEIWPNRTECTHVPKNFLHLLRDAQDTELPWPGIVFGLSISSIWYWCSDQVIVQRVLASKNFSHAKASCVVAGYLKLLPMFFMVFPGMAARVLFPDEVACVNPDVCERVCGSRLGCTNIAYPKIVLELMPQGLRGLMLAVMMAALMSSLTSIFNSSSTIFTIDIWKSCRQTASETELVIVGRIVTGVMILVSFLWVPIIKATQGSQLMHYIQSITSYLAPPIAAVYFLGVFTTRINEKGAFWGLIVGLMLGIVRFILEFFVYPSVPCGEIDRRPSIIKDIHYLHFGLILFLLCVCVIVSVSLLTESPDQRPLARVTFMTRHNPVSKRYEADDMDPNPHDKTDMDMLETQVVEPKTWIQKCGSICCITEPSPTTLSEAEIQEQEQRMVSLNENIIMKRASTVAALFLMVIGIFCFGFFA